MNNILCKNEKGSNFFLLKYALVLFGCTIFVACSSGPATQYYALFPEDNVQTQAVAQGLPAIGVGPIKLPAYLDNEAIVAKNSKNALTVSGYQAWAEPLEEALTRVVSVNLSQQLNHQQVRAFPWDMRLRPEWQLQIHLEHLVGDRGGNVAFIARWTVLNNHDGKILLDERSRLQLDTHSDAYTHYVQAINTLVNQFSNEVAQKINLLAMP